MRYSAFCKVAVHHRVTSSYGSVIVCSKPSKPLNQIAPPPQKKEDVLLVYYSPGLKLMCLARCSAKIENH